MKKEKMELQELESVVGGRLSYRPLKNMMRERGITMQDLMREGIITPLHVTRINAGMEFGYKFYDRLCEYFNCDISDICEDDPYH